jgi:hypothetical protein
VADNLTIVAGTIDTTPIGSSTPSTGVFTNATATNLAVVTSADLQGTLDVTGDTTLADATVTSLAITGFTPGSVLFATTSGNIIEDNANFFWDDTNNRLGIGTSSPSARLELVGTSSAVLNLLSLHNTAGTGGVGTGITFRAGSSGNRIGKDKI